MRTIFLSAFIIAVLGIGTFAQTKQDCLSCHSDQSLVMSKYGKDISLYVDEKQYNNSIHKDFACIDCHTGFDPNNIPHKEKIEPVNCLQCHDVQDYKMSIHYVAIQQNKANAPQCYDCHTKHDIKPATVVRYEITPCINCHNIKEISQYEKSPHAKLRLAMRRAASCSDCHGNGHRITAIGRKREVEKACVQCHPSTRIAFEKSIHGIALKGGNQNAPTCIDCHDSHQLWTSKYAIESKGCLKCHLDEKRFANLGKQKPSVAFIKEYQNSVHARTQGEGKVSATCIDCHDGHEILPASDSTSTVARQHIPTTCGKCHRDVVEQYNASDHGKALAAGVKGAPVCIGCHTEHSIQSITNAASPVSRIHEDAVCLRCHLDNPEVRERVGVSARFISSYEKSAHAIAMKEGNVRAATCSDCHGGHEMKKGSNPTSKVYRMNVAQTCGTPNCHSNITQIFNGSVHGKALLGGNADSPTCTNCHGQHQILQVEDPHSPVAKANLALQVCSPCHSSVRMTEKYALPSDKYKSYADSYHGLAVRGGSAVAANCASCHGLHNIKPSSDPTSTIHKANLIKTCGQCHPGANENFTKGSVHVVASPEQHPLIYWVTTAYIVLIVTIIGGMFIHNLLDFFRKSKKKLQKRRQAGYEVYSSGLYIRMTLSERLQHGVLLVSFIVLVITGFMLKFPDAWWVRHIREILGEGVFYLRGLLHRIAAVVMVGAALYHLYYIFFVPRGKQLIRDLLPKIQDVKDAVAVLKYNLGMSKEKPLFGRFSYIEKSEYWALVWGTIVMAGTGVVLWFDNLFLGLFSKLFLDVATTIHYYEAWLATLAIIVWHIYFVIFNPDVYPMNLAWLKGTLTEEEMEEEHPLELERIKRETMEERVEKEKEELKQEYEQQVKVKG